MSKQIITIGHRGAKGHEPENTIASFEKAIKLGCDYVELDVHLVLQEAWTILEGLLHLLELIIIVGLI